MATTDQAATTLRSPERSRGSPRDCYVGLRRDELVELLVRHGGLAAAEAAGFRTLFCRLQGVVHYEFYGLREQLKALYTAFDPESDTRPVRYGNGRSRAESQDEFLDHLAHVVEAAHYHPLPEQQLQRALSGATYWGLDLDINPEIFDRLMIYVRGDVVSARVRRDLGTWFRRRDCALDVYERLVLALKLRPGQRGGRDVDTENIYLKMFRDIPQLDLEMLLPGTRVRMRGFDRARIGASWAGGLFSLAKACGVSVTKLALLTSPLTPVGWLIIGWAAITYGVRSFLGYKRTKDQYAYSLTQTLYYQNLGNNSSVLTRLIDEAEDEQAKEAILAYYFLWRQPGEAWGDDRLAQEISRLLEQHTGDPCAFRAREAITKLDRLGIVRRENGLPRVLEPEAAIDTLTRCLDRHIAADRQT